MLHVLPRDVVQTSLRIRQPKTNDYFLVNLGGLNMTSELPRVEDNELHNLIGDLKIEHESKSFDTLKFMFGNAGFTFYDSNYQTKIAEHLKDENEFIQDVYDYDNIEDIPNHLLENVIDRVEKNKASMNDKIQLMKYYFKKQFNLNTDEVVLKELWKYKKFVEAYKNINRSIINDVFGDNIIPLENYKLDEKLRESIITSFNLNKFNKKSDYFIVGHALTSHFSTNCLVKQKDQNNNEEITTNDKFNTLIQLIEDNLKPKLMNIENANLFEMIEENKL